MIGINQFITEEVLGECWHEWEWWIKPDGYKRKRCIKCGVDVSSGNQRTKMRNFSSPADWWYLMDFCINKEWFDDFLIKSGFFKLDGKSNFILIHLNWLRDRKIFPKAIARYYREIT